jgi:gas vesicle protein
MTSSDRPLIEDKNNFTESTDRYTTEQYNTQTTPNNGMSRLIFGILIGATLGGIASVLTNKNSVDRINKNIKNIGNTVKKTATNINDTIQDLGDAVQNVATGVNETYRDVERTIAVTAVDVNATVKDAVNVVKNPINSNVRSSRTNNPASTKEANVNGTLYKLVPIDQEQVEE